MRALEPNTSKLPPDGWCVTSPARPPARCSWCDEPLMLTTTLGARGELRAGVVLCPTCDSADLMPRSA